MEKRTYADRAEYIKKAVEKRRKKIKLLAIQHKGSKCFLCGYNRFSGALDFHHLNNKKKEFGLSAQGLTRSWEKTKIELDKCILVCVNCHREIHGNYIEIKKQFNNRKIK